MKNISIKWKVFSYLIGFCGILLVLLWLFQVVFLDDLYKAIKIREIKTSGSALEKNISSESLDELVSRISISNDICIEILSEDGMVLYSADVLRDCILHKIPGFEKVRLVRKTLEAGGTLLEYFNRENFRNDRYDDARFIGRVPPRDLGMEESIILSKIVTDSAGKKRIILLNSVVSPVSSTIVTIRVGLYFITGFMILCSVILAVLIAKRVSEPIEKLNQSAKILARGKYDVTFAATGYKEIAELSDTLNYASVELSKVDHLRKELIANVSHDLRTPLTLISGYAEAMRDLPDENNSENAQIIVDETKRLTTLVNDLLDLSKLQSGMRTIEAQEYCLTTSLRGIVSALQELIRNEGYTIEFHYGRDIYITADESKISQAFYNLLINAVNYTGEDKRIVVRQIKEDHSVKIEVIDSGEGISEENLPYIWDRYYKVDKSHKRAVTGTGLGLSIVKSVIELHNGEYGVSSKVNEGTVFWFRLFLDKKKRNG
mgnify:CR=1 FL=1